MYVLTMNNKATLASYCTIDLSRWARGLWYYWSIRPHLLPGDFDGVLCRIMVPSKQAFGIGVVV